MKPQQILAEIQSWLVQILGLAFLLLIAAAVFDHMGLHQGIIRVLNPTELAYLAGAWWLVRK